MLNSLPFLNTTIPQVGATIAELGAFLAERIDKDVCFQAIAGTGAYYTGVSPQTVRNVMIAAGGTFIAYKSFINCRRIFFRAQPAIAHNHLNFNINANPWLGPAGQQMGVNLVQAPVGQAPIQGAVWLAANNGHYVGPFQGQLTRDLPEYHEWLSRFNAGSLNQQELQILTEEKIIEWINLLGSSMANYRNLISAAFRYKLNRVIVRLCELNHPEKYIALSEALKAKDYNLFLCLIKTGCTIEVNCLTPVFQLPDYHYSIKESLSTNLKNNPELANLLYELAMKKYEQGFYDLAFEMFDVIPENNPNYLNAKYNCAHLILTALHQEGETDSEFLKRKYELVIEYFMLAKERSLLKSFVVDQYRWERGEFKGAIKPGL